VPIFATDISAAVGIPDEVSNEALVAGWDAVTLVKPSRCIVEASTTPFAVAQVFRTYSTFVGILELFLLLLSAAAFLVFRLLGIQALLVKGNLFLGESFVGECVLALSGHR
jgi:hypothetical protein